MKQNTNTTTNVAEPHIPYGSIEEFYNNCVYGDKNLESKYKDEFYGTVLFHKAIRKYFERYNDDDNTILAFTGYLGDGYLTYNGRDIVFADKNIKFVDILYNKLVYLSSEDNKYYHFFTRISDKSYMAEPAYMSVEELEDDKEYPIAAFTRNLTGYPQNLGSLLCTDLPTSLSKIATMSIVVPKVAPTKHVLEDITEKVSLVNPEETELATSIEEYNNNPLECKYTGSKILTYYGMSLEGFRFLSQEVINKLPIKFGKKYTKKDLLNMGIKIIFNKRVLLP